MAGDAARDLYANRRGLIVSAPKPLCLNDGRRLGWAEYGDRGGVPVFHFHGHPGSRLEGRLADAHARAAGVRLITIDRPGMGLSDFAAGRALLDWPDDVIALADALGLERFAVQGASGGGPYALACAYRLPDRLTACGLLAALGPVDRFGTAGMMPLNRIQFSVARTAPGLLRPLFWAVLGRHRRGLDDPPYFRRLADSMAGSLVRLTGSRQLADDYVASTLEAFRQGARGAAYDARLFVRPWGFRLEDIRARKVSIWHGDRDVHVPIAMAQAVATAIPESAAHFYQGEDHMDVILGHLSEAIEAMRAAA